MSLAWSSVFSARSTKRSATALSLRLRARPAECRARAELSSRARNAAHSADSSASAFAVLRLSRRQRDALCKNYFRRRGFAFALTPVCDLLLLRPVFAEGEGGRDVCLLAGVRGAAPGSNSNITSTLSGAPSCASGVT